MVGGALRGSLLLALLLCCAAPRVAPAAIAMSGSQPLSKQAQLRALSSKSRWREVVELFDSFGDTPGLNLACFTEAMSAHSRLGDADSALSLFQRMQKMGISPTVRAYTVAIRACATSHHWPVALSLMEDMRGEGLQPDTVACNALLAACDRGAQWEEALLLLEDMRRKGPTPDVITINSAISAAARAGRWQVARPWSCLVSSLASFLPILSCIPVSLLPSPLTPSDLLPHWSLLTRALCFPSREVAISLLDSMARQDPPQQPDCYTYAAVISACDRGRQPELALDFLHRMQASSPIARVLRQCPLQRTGISRHHLGDT